MKIRCDLHLGNQDSKIILVPKPEERADHIALKLAAYVMFHPRTPIIAPSADHASLSGFDMRPDLMALNEAGEIDLWIECGFVTLHKVNKISRRFNRARFVVLKSTIREAERLRKDLKEQIRHEQRIEIWAWPDGEFNQWVKCLGEKTEVFGEAHEKSFNLVVNETPIALDLLSV